MLRGLGSCRPKSYGPVPCAETNPGAVINTCESFKYRKGHKVICSQLISDETVLHTEHTGPTRRSAPKLPSRCTRPFTNGAPAISTTLLNSIPLEGGLRLSNVYQKSSASPLAPNLNIPEMMGKPRLKQRSAIQMQHRVCGLLVSAANPCAPATVRLRKRARWTRCTFGP